MAEPANENLWEVRPAPAVSRGGRSYRDFVARKRGSGEFAGLDIIAVLPWKREWENRDVREHEERCAGLFLRCVKEMARQDRLPRR